ncbi:uncharacterized protein LOC111055705 isoform X1 [Nilaparvata lugens]|uniref:uncharacterized protein LOC111055705 isoform X1 n=1 Tax=Nilaparvata lugens TaxID=108931 RepID=UPI000B98D232|nr:uncharacterized protein LOC111055705 isoform X1 [Nilaparvata lugens]
MWQSWGGLAPALALALAMCLLPICGTLHMEEGGGAALALYQEPSVNLKESSTPRLNSIIVKSKPYSVNDSLQLLHQALDGKTWRREVPVTVMTSTTNMDDTTVTTQATTSGQELATDQQYLGDCSEDKTCTEMTTPGPTFRPYSQEELDKFLQKASATGVQHTSPRTGDNLEETDQPTNKLANLYIEDEAVNVLETTPEPGTLSSGHDKSKSWNLVSSQTHKHPYDDRNGWVSLEPIPWSLSQIQKWEPNPHTRPQIPSWSSASSSSSSSSSHQHSPGWSSSSSSRPPQGEYGKPSWVKPTYDYRPQESYHKPSSWSQASPKPTQHGPPPGWGGASGDIITDGHPGYFPSEKPGYQEQGSSASFHRPQVIYKDQYNGPQSNSAPSDGDGRWVLLSSTKGYSFPQRQRSTGRRAMRPEENEGSALFQSVPLKQRSSGRRALRLEAPEENEGDATFQSVPLKPALKSRRTVRLTVLPPLEGSANTTTSHGGLLEVEKTSETVEESQRAYAARMLRLQAQEAEGQTKEPEQVRPKPEKRQTSNTTSSQRNLRAERRLGTTMRVVPASRVQSPSHARNNAVLAAVGAGMIPATVAMLLPMVLGRKRRKRDTETHYEPVPLTVVESPHRRRRKPIKKIIVRKKPTEVVYY